MKKLISAAVILITGLVLGAIVILREQENPMVIKNRGY